MTSNPQNEPLPLDAELAHKQALAYGRDLARIYQREREERIQLELAYQALDAIFANAPDGLLVLNDDYTIQRANAKLASFVGLGQPAEMPGTLIGRRLEEVFPAPPLLAALQQVAADETAPHEVEFTIAAPHKLALAAKIGRLQSGDLRGWVVTIRDQSYLKRLEHQKIEFINIAAHELRTPLNVILSYIELLLAIGEDGQEPAVRRGYLEAISQSGRRLDGIVRELVRFADLSQGDLSPQGIMECDLGQIAQEALAELRSYADESLVTLQLLIPEPLPRMQAEPALLRTALYQLALNGIKFNQPGGFVRVEAFSDGGGILVRVVDTGGGIPQSRLDAIFQPFFQVENYMTRQFGGLGLGLSITKRAVERLGGTILVESTGKQGTTFALRLPLNQPSPESELRQLRTSLQAEHRQSLAYAHDLQVLYRRLKEYNRQLEQINVQLDEANKLKSNFLSIISHELRSPFVALDFSLQAFKRSGSENLTANQQDLFAEITERAKEAYEQINQLVKYANLLSKQKKLQLEPLSLGELVEKAAAPAQLTASRRGVALNCAVSPDLPSTMGDAELLSEALWQLLDNALKFTPAGGEVNLRVYTEMDNYVFEVSDTGPGITPERQAAIWDTFTQLADPLARGLEGLGLGLALVRYVALAHRGNVILHSEPGVGSVFGFWIPSNPMDQTVEP